MGVNVNQEQASSAEQAFKVGDAVALKADLYEPADDHSPGGYLARRGEKLIVREVRSQTQWPLRVSHEHRTDGRSFVVGPAEVTAWTETGASSK